MSDDEARARAEARLGTVLKDKWRLDTLLGVGGMGAVYAATHRNKMRVAVKMLHPELCGNESIRTRFLREGYLANTVEHPGAVAVQDDDIAEDGSAFLVMELLDGETVEARWKRKGETLETQEVLAIADKLLDVLSAAHAKGVVHRDIKPENLFITRTGTLKVLDFGIARIFESRESEKVTRAGLVMGTPAFMAPEQALANWEGVDARTDIWAVGATMFTLLTGRHVHEGATGNEQLIKSATTPAPSLGSVAALPAPLVRLVDRALAFRSADRWPDARAAREALRAAYAEMRGEQAAAAPVPRVSLPAVEEVADPASEPSLPSVDPAALRAQLAARTAERDARAADLARIMPAYNEVKGRLAASQRKVADIQQRITALRNERAAVDLQWKRQSVAKSAVVGEARDAYRREVAEFAHRALADTSTFRDEFSRDRDEVARLGRASRAAAHGVEVCEAALVAYDARAVQRGLLVVALGAGAMLLLFLLPFIIRAIAGPAPPPTLPG